jgi:hypothetical protein
MDTVSGVTHLASDLCHFPQTLLEALSWGNSPGNHLSEAAIAEQLMSELRERHWHLLVALGGRVVPVSSLGLIKVTSDGPQRIKVGIPAFQLYEPEKCLTALRVREIRAVPDELRRLQGAIAFLMGNHLESLQGLPFGDLNPDETSLLVQAHEISLWLEEWRIYPWARFFGQMSNAYQQGFLELFIRLSPYGNWEWVRKPGASDSTGATLFLFENASIAVRESVELLKRDANSLGEPAYRAGWEMIRESSFAFISEGAAMALCSAMYGLNCSPQGREHAASLIRHFEALRSAHLEAKNVLG